MVTHRENIKKRYEIGNDGNNYKAVNQYDLDGNYIATYKSSYEAEKITGVGRASIGGCCRKEHNTAGGYIWKFAEKKPKHIEEIEEIELLGQGDNWLETKTMKEHIDMELNPYIIKTISKNFEKLYDKQCELTKAVNYLLDKEEK